MMDYKTFKHIIITAGDAKRADLSFMLDRTIFNSKLNKQLSLDPNLTDDNIISIMVLANSYLVYNLFDNIMKNTIMGYEVLEFWIKHRNELNGDHIRLSFYKGILRYHKKLITKEFVELAFQVYSISLKVDILTNPIACGFLDEETIAFELQFNRDDPYFVKGVRGFEHLNDAYLKVYNDYDNTIYLADEVKALFVF